MTNGICRILPFMYRSFDEAIAIFWRRGVKFRPADFPFPTSAEFQWAHAGEILICAYFEECEEAEVFTYKWRLNTSRNQHQLGMDILAFNLKLTPPRIYAIAVKTTDQGRNGHTPSVVSKANSELKAYLSSDKLGVFGNRRGMPQYIGVGESKSSQGAFLCPFRLSIC
ncbi:MAG: hypothetical protein AB7O81_33450 [Blastocatellales bacterium]